MNLTKEQKETLHWCCSRLNGCYLDSMKMRRNRERQGMELSPTAESNIKRYCELMNMLHLSQADVGNSSELFETR